MPGGRCVDHLGGIPKAASLLLKDIWLCKSQCHIVASEVAMSGVAPERLLALEKAAKLRCNSFLLS